MSRSAGDQRDEGYASAVAHYTSPHRRDAVKRHWEEPATRRLLAGVLHRLGGPGGRGTADTDAGDAAPLRVLDVGCGTGGGLALLRDAGALRGRVLEYVGLDLDPHLLAVARERHAADGDVAFIRGDIRDGPPVRDVDCYLSTGVPYSHLTPAELDTALGHLFAAAHARPRPVAVIVDVLGRYSMEWPTRWDRSRWTYRMSFFQGEQDPPTAEMTFWSGAALHAAVADAAHRAGCALTSVTCHDRSVLVGRHSTTGEYAPGLPPFRALVNALWDPHTRVDLDRLRVELELPDAPGEIHAFYDTFTAAWNARIDTAADRAAGAGDEEVAGRLQPALAAELAALEEERERGLGVGHSLTAVALVGPHR